MYVSSFAHQVTIKSIITTLDATRWKERGSLSIQLQKLLQEQVKHGDVILLNKTDMLSESEKSSLLFEIQSINASARTLLTTFSRVKLDVIQKLSCLKTAAP